MRFAGQELLGLLFLVALTKFSYQLPPKMIITKVELKGDLEFVNVSAGVDMLPNDGYAMYFHGELFQKVDVFSVRLGLSFPSANGKFGTPIKTFGDVCKYYKMKSGNMFLNIFFNGPTTNKTFPTSCPIYPGHYFIEGFQFNEKFLPVRFVESKFLAFIDACTKINGKPKCFANAKVWGEIKDRQKWEKEMASRNKTHKT